MGLLESAVAQAHGDFVWRPVASRVSPSRWRLPTCIHIVQNHPFIDGNKRTGAVAALVFLDLNGIEIEAPAKGSLYEYDDFRSQRAGGQGPESPSTSGRMLTDRSSPVWPPAALARPVNSSQRLTITSQ